MQSTERAAVQVRLSGTELAWLDKWRRGQDKIPPPFGGHPGGHPSAHGLICRSG